VETAEASLVGLWDPQRLNRVLSNRVTNAIRYSPNGGDVTIAIRREKSSAGGAAVLSVRDEGLGIPLEEQERVFERFFRGSNVTGRYAGTGLGLSGARQIVEQHGGTLKLLSQEHLGTTITVHLPLAAAELAAWPTRARRAILRLVRDTELPSGDIATHFPEVTGRAISQHLRVLREAGLLSERGSGTRRLYRARPQGLRELSQWLHDFWDDALEDLKDAVQHDLHDLESIVCSSPRALGVAPTAPDPRATDGSRAADRCDPSDTCDLTP
jgi:DNA-binding transcriptional ArsR family regulator